MKHSLIFLTGLMGSGKSTLGARLAQTLRWEFCDMDEEIVRREGKSIPELFREGEAAFRDAETRACLAICRRRNAVVACGGGAVLRKENVRAMRESGLVVFLDRPVENILADVDPSGRPLLAAGPEKLLEIHRARDPIYRQTAHIHLSNDSTPEEGLARLVRAIQSIREESV